jgi:dihydroorotate dehydrogenase
MEHCYELASAAIQAGAAAVSLAPPRGSLPSKKGELVQGRLYGPAILPISIRIVQEMKSQGIPTIACGGIYTQDDIQILLAGGALAVQLDSILWRGASFLSSV